MLNLDLLVQLLVFGVIPLMGAGMLKDFGNAFRLILIRTKETNVTKMKRAIDAIELEIRAQILGMTGIGAGVIFKLLLSLEFDQHLQPTVWSVGPPIGDYLSHVLLSLFCSMLIASLLLPLKYRIKGMLVDFISSQDE